MRRRLLGILATWVMGALAATGAQGAQAERPGTMALREGWAIQAAAKVQAGGAALSQPGYETTGWQPAEVPTTVLGALVKAGVYKDPFFGKNMAAITPEPFKGAWWYRTEFRSDGVRPGAHAELVFEGISFRANVWLNGKKVADKGALFGVWRVFPVDVTTTLHDGVNALAVEVFPAQPGEYAMGFVDWNPVPADRNMGLYRGVALRRSGGVSIEDPFVQSKVDTKTLKEAALTVSARLVNHGERPQAGTLAGAIGALHFQTKYALGPYESKTVRLTPAEAPGLRVRNPRLWWPVNLGSPELYTLELTARAEGRPSDLRSVTFGIREVSDYLNEQGHRGYLVNGQKVLIRGGGWVDDIFLREDERNLEAQLDYVRHMNLNTVRLEGFWGASQRLYDIADRKGILVMTGFSCQWEWDHYLGKPQDNKTYGAAENGPDADLLVNYLRDQVLWLRHHPSVLVWVVGSDKLPYPNVERRYRDLLRELDPGRPYLASAKTWKSEVSGPTAVKMLGPYNYVTPNFWYEDRTHGGAYGFNTETGPGPQVPPLASLKKMIPADKLWPINDFWNFHCAEHEYSDLSLFLNAFNHRYGAARGVEEFAFKSQAASYEAMRAMFEAFGAAKPRTTGIIQWMLNGAWPKLYWQLYDYYLMPTGAFYGARKSSQPHNVVYDYATRAITLVNDTLAPVRNASLQVTLLDAASKPVLSKRLPASVAANAAARLFDLPALDGTSPVYFLDLKLHGPGGRVIAENFYWLSPKPDVLDMDKYTEPFVPNKSFTDFTALNALPPAKVKVASSFAGGKGQVTLTNTSDKVAFFIELQLNKGETRDPVLPVLWEDNYVSLLPGETKTIKASFAPADLQGTTPALAVNGWNLAAVR
jgi:exo-1,4-beta-D-glucosaminidase